MGLFKLRKKNSDDASDVADVDEWLKALDADVGSAIAGAAGDLAAAQAPDAGVPSFGMELGLDAAAHRNVALDPADAATALDAPPPPIAPGEPESSDDGFDESVWHLPDLDDSPTSVSATDEFMTPDTATDVFGTTIDPSDLPEALVEPAPLHTQPFEPQSFEPQSFEPQSFEPQPFETQPAPAQVDESADIADTFAQEPVAGFAPVQPIDGANRINDPSPDEFSALQPLWGHEAAQASDTAAPQAVEAPFPGAFDHVHRSVEALRPEPDPMPATFEDSVQPAYDLADFGVVLDGPLDAQSSELLANNADLHSASTDTIPVPTGDDAATYLAILGLGRDVSWSQVKHAHTSLIADHLAAGESDNERADLARSIRREINTAYVSLRLLNAPPTP